MYYYAQHSTNGIECFKVEDEKKTIQNYLTDNFGDTDCYPPFRYLNEKQVKDALFNKPDEEWTESQTAYYDALKEYVDSEDAQSPITLVAYPDGNLEIWSPDYEANLDNWESLMDEWAEQEDEFDELPFFFTADEAAEKVEEALEDYNEDKAVAIIQAVFNECEEYQAEAVIACLKLKEELENFTPGDEIPEEVFDGDIGTLCEFAGTDCPNIEAGDLYTQEDWGRKSVEYIDSPQEYFKEFLAENDNLKLPILNGEVDWDNLDSETQQWGAGAWRDYVDSKNADFCYDCLKTIRKAFEALNWTFGTTF